jgi:cell division protein FtsA
MPVRLGVPQDVGGLKGVVQNPIYATGVGLVLYGARFEQGRAYVAHEGQSPGFTAVLNRMKSWFQGNF